MTDLDTEIEKNLEVFNEKLPSLLESHRGRYVLLRHQEIVGIYDTMRDARLTGRRFFEDGIFSIQEVTDEPINLGFFSHAVLVADSQ